MATRSADYPWCDRVISILKRSRSTCRLPDPDPGYYLEQDVIKIFRCRGKNPDGMRALSNSRYVITGERISLLPGEESTTDWYVDRRRLGGVLRNLVGASTWMEGSWLFGSYSGRDLSGVPGSCIPGNTCFFIFNHKNLPLELFRFTSPPPLSIESHNRDNFDSFSTLVNVGKY